MNKTIKPKAPAKKTTKQQKNKVVTKILDPVIVQGSHLTVTTWPDGQTELKWNDEALLRDIQAATLKAESHASTKTTVSKSKRKS